MSRIPRKSLDTSFFHVIVQGINKEYIFCKELYIKEYLKFLNMYNKKYKVEIVAYCIMNNHAHMLIYTDKIEEMSKFMHSVNTAYAKFYNFMKDGRVGYVFKDRYLSEPIHDKRYLIKCIQYIHFNPVKANMVNNPQDYKFSSYNKYLCNKDNINIKCLNNILDCNDYNLIVSEGKNLDICMDIDINKSSILESRIKDFEQIMNKNIDEIFINTEDKKQLIDYLKRGYKIRYVDIMKKLNISGWEMEKLKQKPNFRPRPQN